MERTDQLPGMIIEKRPTSKPIFMKFQSTGDNGTVKRNKTGLTQSVRNQNDTEYIIINIGS